MLVSRLSSGLMLSFVFGALANMSADMVSMPVCMTSLAAISMRSQCNGVKNWQYCLDIGIVYAHGSKLLQLAEGRAYQDEQTLTQHHADSA